MVAVGVVVAIEVIEGACRLKHSGLQIGGKLRDAGSPASVETARGVGYRLK